MKKQTLKFDCLINMAKFSKIVSAGYFMNTSNFTLTGAFHSEEVELALVKYHAVKIATTEKIYSYESL